MFGENIIILGSKMNGLEKIERCQKAGQQTKLSRDQSSPKIIGTCHYIPITFVFFIRPYHALSGIVAGQVLLLPCLPFFVFIYPSDAHTLGQQHELSYICLLDALPHTRRHQI